MRSLSIFKLCTTRPKWDLEFFLFMFVFLILILSLQSLVNYIHLSYQIAAAQLENDDINSKVAIPALQDPKKYVNPLLGIKVQYPNNWTVQENTDINMSDFTPAVNNIFDYLRSVTFSSPIENSSDKFLENFKIMVQPLGQNSTLYNLVNFIHKICNCWPSNQLIDYAIDHPHLKMTLADYMRANIDFLNASIPTFQLRDNITKISVSGHAAYRLIYSFNFDNKMENIEYTTMQIYTAKGNRLYILSYHALEDSFRHSLPIVAAMIKSISLL
jgi:hypothetical protein